MDLHVTIRYHLVKRYLQPNDDAVVSNMSLDVVCATADLIIEVGKECGLHSFG
jgi:hypothetical protein